MSSTGERAQLIAAARLYYEDNLTQAQVAQRLGVSRPLVSKMLDQARRLGIVHIEIRAGEEGEAALLERLQVKYGLLGGCVLQEGQLLQATRYLAAETAGDKNLGLGWGYMLGELCTALDKLPRYQQQGVVCPLMGTAHIPNKGYHPDELARLWGESSGRSCYSLGCPAFPASEEERSEWEQHPAFLSMQALWQQLDAAIICLNDYPCVPDEATATRFGDALQKQHAAGSFLSYYYNQRGEFISGNNDFCLHIPLAQLRRCRKLIAVALKVNTKAVAGALATGLFTHLVITEEQGRALL